MADPIDPKAIIPPPHHWMEHSGNNLQAATNKTESLAAVIECGSVKEAIKAGKIDQQTLARYLADPNYHERLRSIETHLAGLLVSKATELALNGSERMLEFVTPALDARFDAGVRRQQTANRGAIDSILMAKALDGATVELDPLLSGESPLDSMPDNSTYRASGSEPLAIGQGKDAPNSDTALEPSIAPIDDDYTI